MKNDDLGNQFHSTVSEAVEIAGQIAQEASQLAALISAEPGAFADAVGKHGAFAKEIAAAEACMLAGLPTPDQTKLVELAGAEPSEFAAMLASNPATIVEIAAAEPMAFATALSKLR